MKLKNLGVRFLVDYIETDILPPNKPARLIINGKIGYMLHSCPWGFILDADSEMTASMLMSGIPINKKDLALIVVDVRGFQDLDMVARMNHVSSAIRSRASENISGMATSAISWWADQVLENDNQSP